MCEHRGVLRTCVRWLVNPPVLQDAPLGAGLGGMGGSRSKGWQGRGWTDEAVLWDRVKGMSRKGRKGECGGRQQVAIQSPGVVRFGTDQSDILCDINMTVGQHSFYEHCQVGAPILQVRR